MPSEAKQPDADHQRILREVIGYLNFSDGTPDATFQKNLNALFAQAEASQEPQETPSDSLALVSEQLLAGIALLNQTDPAFGDVTQADAVVRLATEDFRTAYREFHRDLLWHRSPRELWRPFFLARVLEGILAEGPPWDQSERIVSAARDRLDDYIGYRPVAVLETEQRIEPYRHEWVRPIPLYIAGVGVATGPYQQLLEQTLAILRETDPALRARRGLTWT